MNRSLPRWRPLAPLVDRLDNLINLNLKTLPPRAIAFRVLRPTLCLASFTDRHCALLSVDATVSQNGGIEEMVRDVESNTENTHTADYSE